MEAVKARQEFELFSLAQQSLCFHFGANTEIVDLCCNYLIDTPRKYETLLIRSSKRIFMQKKQLSKHLNQILKLRPIADICVAFAYDPVKDFEGVMLTETQYFFSLGEEYYEHLIDVFSQQIENNVAGDPVMKAYLRHLYGCKIVNLDELPDLLHEALLPIEGLCNRSFCLVNVCNCTPEDAIIPKCGPIKGVKRKRETTTVDCKTKRKIRVDK